MLIQIELWHLVTLLLSFFACVGAFGKILLWQFEKRQSERFAGQEKLQTARFTAEEKSRREFQEQIDRRLSALESAAKEWIRVERDFLEWKAALPMTYVMRDDYVRNQTVIEAKLDSVAVRIENLQLKGVLQ